MQHHISRLNKAIQLLKNKHSSKGEDEGQAKKDLSLHIDQGNDLTLLKMTGMPESSVFRSILIEDKKEISRLV